MISAETSSIKYEYTYDDRGNILTKKEYSISLDENNEKVYTLIEANTDTYVYDETWKDKLISYNGQSITYDAVGNPINYMGKVLTWTMGRQLTTFGDISYTYNENGIRTSKTVSGVKTTFLLDGYNVIEQTDGTTTLHFFYDSNDEVIGFRYNGNDYFYVKNAMSDIIAITDGNKNIVAEYRYDPWGKVLNEEYLTAIGNLNPFRYRSYYYDSDIKMYYLQSRYYDAEIGRFINCDDVNYIGVTGSEVSYNPFAYCQNEPVNVVDLFGTTPIKFRSGYTLDEYTEKFYGGDEYSYVNNSPSLKNKFMGKAWLAAAKLIKKKYPDGYNFYMHYREGKGKPYIYDYDKAIREDSKIMEYENELIVDFMKFVKKKNLKSNKKYAFTSCLNKKVGTTPKTVNWKLAIGTHLLVLMCEVILKKSTYTADIYIIAYDRYNFSSAAKFAGVIPGSWNGELVSCGMACNFTSYGLAYRKVSWRR